MSKRSTRPFRGITIVTGHSQGPIGTMIDGPANKDCGKPLNFDVPQCGYSGKMGHGTENSWKKQRDEKGIHAFCGKVGHIEQNCGERRMRSRRRDRKMTRKMVVRT